MVNSIRTVLVAFALATVSSAANATCPTFHTLSNGTTADAGQVMDNFSYILTCPTIVHNGNGDADVNVLNNSSATNVSSRITLTNGASSGLFVQYGTNYTTAGLLRQDGTLVYGNGAGGLTLDTGAAQPIYFGINSIEVARLTAADFHIGSHNNQDTSVSVANNSTGSIANARFTLSNGTSSALLVQYGSGYTTSGILRQNGTLVFGNGAGGLTLATGAAQPIYFGINSGEAARFDTNGYLLLGYTSSNGAYKLQVNSQIFATSATIATSDRKLKSDLGSPSAALLDAALSVSAHLYTRKDHPEHGVRAGYWAQDWLKALKENGVVSGGKNGTPSAGMVPLNNDGYYGLDEAAVQTLKIAALEKNLRKLSAVVLRLEAANNRQVAVIGRLETAIGVLQRKVPIETAKNLTPLSH